MPKSRKSKHPLLEPQKSPVIFEVVLRIDLTSAAEHLSPEQYKALMEGLSGVMVQDAKNRVEEVMQLQAKK